LGLGRGYSDKNCSGTGAGHAGRGGPSKECMLAFGAGYNTKATDTMYEGSGGGSSGNSS